MNISTIFLNWQNVLRRQNRRGAFTDYEWAGYCPWRTNMKKQLVFTIVLVSIFFVCVAFNAKAKGANCCPAPCDEVCPAPCDNICQRRSNGCYLTEKSIFESRLFENQLIGKKSRSRIQFYGWMLTGITVNNHGSTNAYGGNPNPGGASTYEYNNRRYSDGSIKRAGYNDQSGNSSILMLEQPTDWKLNHLWIGARRDLTNRLDWGFQADFLYGTDTRYTRNWGDRSFDYDWGSGDYYPSFAQLFATVGTKDLFVKAGKFSGGFAYEGLAAPREFFYSHANICYGRPFVTNGVMLEWHPNKKWMFTGGWTAGVYNCIDNPFEDNGFLGKATYNFTKDVSLTYKIFYNDKGYRNDNNIAGIDCLNTLIFTWKINKKWFYMGEIAYTDNKTYTVGGTQISGNAWGLNNHLIRTLNEKWSVGFRGEFHHSHNSFFDNANVTYTTAPGLAGNGGQGCDIWTFTVATHYKINPKTTLRPEIRYDYADYNNGYRPFGGGNDNAQRKNDQFCGGVSFIVMF